MAISIGAGHRTTGLGLVAAGLTAALLVVLGAFSQANAQQSGVVMHADPNFGGTSWSVDVGVYEFPAVRDSPIGNDKISSMTIPDGYEVFACQHQLFAGTCQTYTESAATLGSLDNEISSFQVLLPDPAADGRWGEVIDTPLVPVAAAALPNGKVMMWSAYDRNRFGGSRGYTQTSLFDPATNSSTLRQVSNTGHDMFCPGIANLADGRVLVNGGSNSSETSIYNPDTDSWEDADDMNIARGYNATTLLSDGSAFTLGGSWSGGRGNKNAERWTDETGWQRLNGIPAGPFQGNDPGGVYRSDNHMWLFGWKDRTVFHAGPATNMHWIDTNGSGSYSAVGTRASDSYAMNGNAVMYAPGKILTNGGATAYAANRLATANATVIDITGPTVTARTVDSMSNRRVFQSSTVLPNGEVLVTGGQEREDAFTDNDSVMAPELWNPDTETFREVAPMAVPRNYHSIGLLLPDARVMVGGGGLCNCGDANHPDVQIYSPPYLFDADGSEAERPVISSAPDSVDPNQVFQVATDRPVSEFALVRTSASTHTVNLDQRRIPLNPVPAGGNNYDLRTPADTGVVIPGAYLLFALDADGVPSVSKTVMVTERARIDSDGDGVFDFEDAYPNDPLRWIEPVATQSSTILGGSAERAIDGDTNGVWSGNSVTHTDNRNQPWWEVNLGHSLDLDLVIHNRTDCCSDRLSNFYVFVSDEGFGERSLQSLLDDDSIARTHVPGTAPARLELDDVGVGSYIRIQLAGQNVLSLAEVEVIASAPPADDRDGDGVPDDQDVFPDDPTEWADTDGDGQGDNADPTPNGEGQPPANAVRCADEQGACVLPDDLVTTVWYGADSLWYSRANVSGQVQCSNDVFGDPAQGSSKACYYEPDLPNGPGSIAGSVSEADGSARTGAAIDLFEQADDGSRGQFLASTATGTDGTYRFGELESDCYVLTFIAPTGELFSNGSRWLQAPLCIDPAENRSGVDATLAPPAPDSGVGGSVTYSDGQPAVGVTAVLYQATADGGRGQFLTGTETGADGNYQFPADPGCYVIDFVAPEGASFDGRQYDRAAGCVEAGELLSGLDAVLDRDSERSVLTGSVSRVDGSAAAGVSVDLFAIAADGSRGSFLDSTVTDADGSFSFSVEPSCHVLTFIAPEGESFSGSTWFQPTVCPDEDGSFEPTNAALGDLA